MKILVFSSPNCSSCKEVYKILEDIELDLDIEKIDVTKDNRAQKYMIMSVPTILFEKDKKIINQIIGLKSKAELVKEIKKFK